MSSCQHQSHALIPKSKPREEGFTLDATQSLMLTSTGLAFQSHVYIPNDLHFTSD